MTQKLLLSGATILIGIMGSFLGNLGYDWVKDVNADRRETAKFIIQFEARSLYLHGNIPAVPVSTPSERLKETADK